MSNISELQAPSPQNPSLQMPLYFKEFDIGDAIFHVTGSPTISHLEGWEPLDYKGSSILMAKDLTEAGKTLYHMMKNTGAGIDVGNLQPGSKGNTGLKLVNSQLPHGPTNFMIVRWFDIVKPIGILRSEDNDGTVGFVVYFKFPENSKSDVLVAIAKKLVPVNRDEETSDIGRLFYGECQPFAPPVMRTKPRPWTSSDPEVIEAGEKLVVMPAEVLEHLKAHLMLKKGDPVEPVDDGSLVKIFPDGRLWSSNTASPATYHWVPIVRQAAHGHCAGDKHGDWMPHLIGV
jgi:hypothetical protein